MGEIHVVQLLEAQMVLFRTSCCTVCMLDTVLSIMPLATGYKIAKNPTAAAAESAIAAKCPMPRVRAGTRRRDRANRAIASMAIPIFHPSLPYTGIDRQKWPLSARG